jgi:hypothetical protein
VNFNFFVKLYIGDFDGVIEQGDPSIPVDDSGLTQAKDVLERGVGFGQGKGAEEAVAISPGSVEADAGDLFGGGVDLMVIVAVYFFLQDKTNIFNSRDVFQSTGTNDAVLQPAVRSLDFSLGLRGQGIDDIHAQDTHHFAPLGVDVIRLQDVLTPEAVSTLDEAEDA